MAGLDVHLVRHAPTAHELHGIGGQFDYQLFTDIGQPVRCTPQQLADLQGVIRAGKVGHSRIKVPRDIVNSSSEREAVMDTIRLAHDAGANVNLTWWSGPYFKNPKAKEQVPCRKRKHGAFVGDRLMKAFADVVEAARRDTPCVTHLTIQNEVNAHDIALQCDVRAAQKLYRRLYVLLARELEKRKDPHDSSKTLRDTVSLVGGDLLDAGMKGLGKAGSQDSWLRFMHEHMADLVDGYSLHVYWEPREFPAKLEKRLERLHQLMHRELKSTHPLYVTEYGVRKLRKPRPGTIKEPGAGGAMVKKNLEDSVEGGFQHAWFNALAPQCGCAGLAKWALYRTDGPEREFGLWGMIGGPAERFRLTPAYQATALFNRAVGKVEVGKVGWRATGLFNQNGLLVSRFDGPEGAHSVFVLNRGSAPQRARIHDLLKNAEYSVAVWNRDGDGKATTKERLNSNAQRVAVVNLRPRRMVVLSTTPLSPTPLSP